MPAAKRLRIPVEVLERATAQASMAPRPPSPPPKPEPQRRLPREKIVLALKKLHPMD